MTVPGCACSATRGSPCPERRPTARSWPRAARGDDAGRRRHHRDHYFPGHQRGRRNGRQPRARTRNLADGRAPRGHGGPLFCGTVGRHSRDRRHLRVFSKRAYGSDIVGFGFAWMMCFTYGPGATAVVAIMAATFLLPVLEALGFVTGGNVAATAIALIADSDRAQRQRRSTRRAHSKRHHFREGFPDCRRYRASPGRRRCESRPAHGSSR